MNPSAMCATISTGVSNGSAVALWLRGYGIITMPRIESLNEHERLKELCALAQTGSLTFREKVDLELRLETCGTCRELRDQYAAIGTEGMAFLSLDQPLIDQAEGWDNSTARERLFSSLRKQSSPKVLSIMDGLVPHRGRLVRLMATRAI